MAPLSSVDKPKQFHALADNNLSLLQQTILRVEDDNRFAPPAIFGNVRHATHIQEQVAEVECVPLITFLEPVMRNTAAPILLSAFYAQDSGFRYLLVQPSDHCINSIGAFIANVLTALNDANIISYFGITPDRAYSGYGYIQESAQGVLFHEKPDLDKAAFLISQGALWNSGIFLLEVSGFLKEAACVMPDLFEALSNDGFDAYSRISSLSFDKAFCERTIKGRLYKADFDWMDMGSWDALCTLISRESVA